MTTLILSVAMLSAPGPGPVVIYAACGERAGLPAPARRRVVPSAAPAAPGWAGGVRVGVGGYRTPPPALYYVPASYYWRPTAMPAGAYCPTGTCGR